MCVRNLDVTVNESQLKELFQTVGQVGMVTIPKDHDGQHKGYAYIELNSEESKNRAISSLNGQKIWGKEISVEPKRTNVAGYNKMKSNPLMNMLGMFASMGMRGGRWRGGFSRGRGASRGRGVRPRHA